MSIGTQPSNYKEFIEATKEKYTNRTEDSTNTAARSGTEEVPQYKVSSVEEYLTLVDYLNKKVDSNNKSKLWYRGVKAAGYDLLPSIMRGDLNANLELKYLSKFKSLANPYLENIPGFPYDQGIPSYWGWLFLMQHYGVATRIMDWSKDALVALIFACKNRSAYEQTQDAGVYALNPTELNTAFNLYSYLPAGYVPNAQENRVYELFGPDSGSADPSKKPLAVIGPWNSPRIMAQKGTFTVFPHITNPVALNKIEDSSKYLYKITISRDACDRIVAQLANYGILEASLFPELASVTQLINDESF